MSGTGHSATIGDMSGTRHSTRLPGFRFAYDLGQEWQEWTGLPFVYAVWAVRPGADLRGVDDALRQAKEQGLAEVGQIAARESRSLGLDAGFCRRYLETLIRFDLGPREVAGLERYYELAAGLGLAPAGRALRFYRGATTSAKVCVVS